MLRPCSPNRFSSHRGLAPRCSPSAPSGPSPLLHRQVRGPSSRAVLVRQRARRGCCGQSSRRGSWRDRNPLPRCSARARRADLRRVGVGCRRAHRVLDRNVSPLLHRLCHEASCGAPLLRYRALRRCCRRCARRGLRCARRACSPAAASRWPPASSVLPGRSRGVRHLLSQMLNVRCGNGSSVAHLLRSLMDGSCSVLAPGSVRSMVLAAHPNETGGDGVGLGTRREA